MKRIFHHYDKWEDALAGMWRKASKDEEAELLPKAIQFTGNASLYGEYMLRVVEDWPYSCEQNLSAKNMNRQAWVGHAACCMAIGCPEYITRLAWWELTQEQRDAANLQADEAIALWESKRCQSVA